MNGNGNNNNSGGGNGDNLPPLTENEFVQQLYVTLQENGRDTSGLSALLHHVSEMENFIKRAEDRIADMKSQLADMKEVQNHPIKTALSNAIKTLEQKVAEVKIHLADLKHNIIEGCKNANAAFKEKGAEVLDKLASFFHIKGALKAIDHSTEQSIKACDKSIANIDAFAAEYHKAGRAIKNMGRMLIGKEPIDAKKEAGILAKSFSAPYKAQKAVMTEINKAVGKAASALERLAQRKTERQAENADKPDMLGKINTNKQRVEREKSELPTPERTKTKGAEI